MIFLREIRLLIGVSAYWFQGPLFFCMSFFLGSLLLGEGFLSMFVPYCWILTLFSLLLIPIRPLRDEEKFLWISAGQPLEVLFSFRALAHFVVGFGTILILETIFAVFLIPHYSLVFLLSLGLGSAGLVFLRHLLDVSLAESQGGYLLQVLLMIPLSLPALIWGVSAVESMGALKLLSAWFLFVIPLSVLFSRVILKP